ncbi:MAG: LytTR family DNA-binding domain-containing protein [Kofleriaceae bacterium]
MRVVVVDDEPPARLRLRQLVARTAALDLVGEAEDGESALRLIRAVRPDLVFLDMELPRGGGLEVVAALGDELPALVVVTAFDRYAVPAFDAGAVEYLLKPFDDDRFELAVERISRRVGPPRASAPSVLTIRERGRTARIPIPTVEWVEAQDQYAVLHLQDGGEAWMRSSLRELESVLQPHGFVRAHRSALVDPRRVRELRSRSHGDVELVLASGARVRASRTFRAELVEALSPRAAKD